MPELPEVETVVRTLAPHLPGRQITAAEFSSRFVTPGNRKALATKVTGRTIVSVKRRGKFIEIALDQGKLTVHLGMTGRLLLDAAPGKHTYGRFTLNSGTLIYDDPRQFGRVLWNHDLSHLGPEPLEIGLEEFQARLKKRSSKIKALLLDQSFVAGVGNIYADETLFAAGVHPLTVASRLTTAKIGAIHAHMQEILARAIRLGEFEKIRQICDEVGAIMWVDAAHFIGLVAGKAIPSPVPYADVVSFTTHKVLRGPRGGMILSKAAHAAAIDKAVFPGMQGGPIMSAVAGKAIALKECATAEYQAYAKNVIKNCQVLASSLEKEGMRAVSGGTQTHLALIDIRNTGVNGKVADERCGASGITLNKNSIPYDPETPAVTSGIRVGSAAITTQGMSESEMPQIASFIGRAIRDGGDATKAAEIRREVHDFTAKFPVYKR